MVRYCLALDLEDDTESIAEYRRHHANVWPEVVNSIRSAGVLSMEIYLIGNRLFMIMETEDWFSFEAKQKSDAENSAVQAWETLMWRYQQALPQAKPGEKWLLMQRIFALP